MADGRASRAGPARPVAQAVAAWAKALSEVGGRNTLLWAPEHPGGDLDLTTAHPGGVSRLLAGRVTYLSDLVREPGALAEALEVARGIHDRARQLEERRGLVSCFVAVGRATWDHPRPGATVAAPVLLRGCRLRPTSPAADDFHVDLSHSVEVNPVLVNYLRSVAGISVDPVELADLARVTTRFDPYPVYAVLRQSCASIPGFTIRPRLVLGVYPYTKLPMVADVTENGERFAEVDLVAALAGDPDARARVGAPLPDVMADPDPAHEVLVLDADAGQGSVVEAVRAGRSLVLAAPHGTGATQTVANVVAALAHDGMRTLVVTPFPATITDLADRLAAAQLGDLLLDLTRAGSDRHLLAARLGERSSELRDDDGPVVDEGQRQQREAVLSEARRRLADHVEAMHVRREPWGVTLHEVQSAMAQLGTRTPAPASRVRIRGAALRELRRDTVDNLTGQLRGAATAGAWSDDPADDPWYGARITTGEQVAQARQIVTRLAGGGLAAPAEVLDGILAESALPAARCVDDWGSALRTMRGVRDTLEVFRPEIFDVPLDEHLVATGSRSYRAAAQVKLGLLARSRLRRQTKWLLRPGRPPADLHAELRSAQEQRQAWHRLVGAGGRPEISPRLDEAEQVFDVLDADLTWLGERLFGADGGPDLLRLPVPDLRDLLDRLAARLDRLDVLPAVSPTLAHLRAAGMGEVVDDFARRCVSADQVRPELEQVWWASLYHEITENDARCREHDGPQLREAAHRFRRLDVEQRDDTARLVRARVAERARRQLADHPRQAELVRARAAGERRPLPFAEVFDECQDVLTAVFPCLALSPYAVGQLLPPDARFDAVVVQDASSVTTAEVVSALARGRAAVLVGDPAGVRPSPFAVGPSVPGRGQASTLPPTDREGDATASVLDDAGAVLPVRRLTWRHGDVDARLAPLADSAGLGAPAAALACPVRFERVDSPTRDGDESPQEPTGAENARIVDIVLHHARTTPERSLGVVALTPALARQVEGGLRRALDELARRDRFDPALAFFDEDRREPMVVTDLDTAHTGREVLVVGVGHGGKGTAPPGSPSLAPSHVEQRLALVTSLARRELVVVSSLSAGDLDAGCLGSPGAMALRDLLAFAEREGRPRGEQRRGDLDPLLAYLARRLTDEGLVALPHVGPGAYPVELAVGRPGGTERFLLAVEMDGPTYAGLAGVRERERLRIEQLQRLGWTPLRIWTSDLYRDPAREVARVLVAVRRAHRLPEGSLDDEATAGELPAEPEESAPSAQPSAAPEAAPGGGPATDAQDGPDEVAAAGADGPESAPSPPGDRRREPSSATSDAPRGRRRLRWRQGRSSKDSESNWDDFFDDDARDRWLQEQRPPHWE